MEINATDVTYVTPTSNATTISAPTTSIHALWPFIPHNISWHALFPMLHNLTNNTNDIPTIHLLFIHMNQSNLSHFQSYRDHLDRFSPCPSTQMPMGTLISMILYTVVCIIGLLGNTLVIYVVLRFSKMQTVTNMYILNLAIADECFLIGIPFLITTMHLGEWTFGSTMCKAYMVSTSVTQFTSSIFLFIMSADRFIG